MIIGATSEQDVDVLIDEPRVSGRHARIEIVPCDGGSKCNRDYRRVWYCSTAVPVSTCYDLQIVPTIMTCAQTEHVHIYLVCK